MPELPEMETYRMLLSELVVGRTITNTEIERVKSINTDPDAFRRRITGQAVTRVERRAKHLLFHLTGDQVLLLHLMLGGIMSFGRKEQKPDRTVQVTISFGAEHLYFIGLRLGYLHLYRPEEAEQRLRKLGPDPFDPALTAERFAALLRARSGTLKSALTDQSVLSGIGNCYSDEICFQARLLPARKPASLSAVEWDALFRAMRELLREAVQYGGYMEMPLFQGDALTGGFDRRCRVYGREGEPCARCGGLIERRNVSSKKSFCCPQCQH